MQRPTIQRTHVCARLLSLTSIPAAACAVALASTAFAAPGEHIRTGDAVITPHVAMGLEYYTNPYHSETTTRGDSATGLNITPGLDIRLGGDDVDFDFGGLYTLRKFVGDQESSLDRFSDFSVKADLNANKQGVVGLRLHEGAGIKNQPADARYSDNPFITLTRNQTSGAIVFRPGPAFEATPGGLFEINDYAFVPNVNTNQRSFNTRYTYGPRLGIAWKFLPKTALAVDADYMIDSWGSTVVVDPTGGPNREYPGATRLKVAAGMRGRVTDKLTVTLQGGYGTANFDETSVSDPTFAPDAAGAQKLLVDVGARYSLSDDDRIAVGFNRDITPSYFTAYQLMNKVYATADARFTDRVGVNGEANIRGERYVGQVDRNDLVFDIKGAATYYVQDYASLSLGTQWIQRSSTDARVEYDDFRFSAIGTFTY